MSTALNDYAPLEVGRRLRGAREAAGITQAAAAESIGAARTTLVAIEKGQRKVLLSELQRLCSLYATNVNALLRHDAVQIDFEVQFRKNADCADGPAEAAAKLLSDLVRAELELEALLGIARVRHDPPERSILAGDVAAQAEQDALELRQILGLGMGPIGDLFSLLELSLGVRLFVRKVDSKVSAAFAFSPQTGPCFLLNGKHPRSRRIHSAAHELAHFVSSRSAAKVFIDFASPKSREERYAEAFARAFLTPARQVIAKFQDVTAGATKLTRRHIILLAHYFGVSRESLVRRLEELALVRKGTWDWFSNEGGITDAQAREVLGESFTAEDEGSGSIVHNEWRLHLLVEQVHRKGLMSEGQLASLLQVDRIEIRRIVGEAESEDRGQPYGDILAH
jgi:Zn-dependent peptidase ImmA (M78 family)/DNA-binding XRE family transcriptional regulator